MSEMPMNQSDKIGIRKLMLTNFRCYSSLNLLLDANLPVVLTGNNGAGKTNILEAISFLVPGRGLRHAVFSDVAKHNLEVMGKDEKLLKINPVRWAVSATIVSPKGEDEVGTGCESGEGEGSERRSVRINGQTSKSQSDLATVLSAVWITPAMDRIFSGEVTPRRRFLDRLVQAFDANHASRTNAYAKSYKQWGRLLKEGCRDNSWLTALENTMAEYGVAVAAARNEFIDRLNFYLSKDETDRTFPQAFVSLKGELETALQSKPALAVEDDFKEMLKSSRQNYADGGSVAGPHQTDMFVSHEKGMPASLCSTGEQKALLVAIILAHSKAQNDAFGTAPLMLLDEVGAHLDKNRRDALFDILVNFKAQVWLTGTEDEPFSSLYNRAQFFNVENAGITTAVA